MKVSGLWASVGLFALRGLNAALGFVAAILLTRWLGAASYGVYSIIFAGAAILNVPLSVGGGNLLVREAAKGVAHGTGARVRGLLIRGHQTGAALAFAGAAVASAVLVLHPEAAEGLTPVTIVVLAGIVMADGFAALRAAVIRGVGNPVLGQAPGQLVKPLAFVLALLVAIFGFDADPTVANALIALLVGSFSSWVAGTVTLARSSQRRVLAVPPAYADRDWLRSMVTITLAGGLFVANGYVDSLVLAAVAPPEHVGVYRVAYQVAMVTGLLYAAANLMIGPRIAYHAARGESAALLPVMRATARWTLLAMLPAPIAMLVAGRPLLAFAFGDNFAAAQDPMLILTAGQLANAGIGFVASQLIMTGRERRVTVWAAVGLAMNFVLAALLCPSLGAIGAAIASTASLLVWKVALWVTVARLDGADISAFGMPLERWLGRRVHATGPVG